MLIPSAAAAPHLPRRISASAWIISLFATSVLVQRLSLPGGTVPLLLVAVLGWCAYGLLAGALEFDRLRLSLYLLAAALTAGTALAQQVLVTDPLVSVTSWGLFMTVWAPATLRLHDSSRAQTRLAFEGCVRVGTVLAWACIAMLVAQYAGLRYVDYLALFVPNTLLVDGYVITYPLEYGSEIYRSNAWIGLEPSIVSVQLGICLVLAMLVRSSIPTLITLIAGMVCTVSGSGVFIVTIAVAVMLLAPMRRQLVRYPVATSLVVFSLLQTPMGQQMISRVTEAAFANSSTRLRAVEPYVFIWPRWSSDVAITLFGRGAGSSQQLIGDTNRAGLLVPSPVKVFFDYGVIAGLALAVFLLACYIGGPSRSLSVALLGSSWILQPGTTTVILALPTLLFVTWWAPRGGRVLESEPFPRRRKPAPSGPTIPAPAQGMPRGSGLGDAVSGVQ